jgi:hypothetical protein
MEPSRTALPQARIAHLLPGRLRLHIAARRGDGAFFERVAAALSEVPMVQAVRANPRTASLLLSHTGPVEDLAQMARERGLFDLAPARAVQPATLVRPGPWQAAVPAQPLALASLGFAGLGAVQTLRGRFHGNAAESLWNAYLIHAVHGRPRVSAALVGLGLFQLATGRALGSGVSLFLYALVARNLARMRS